MNILLDLMDGTKLKKMYESDQITDHVTSAQVTVILDHFLMFFDSIPSIYSKGVFWKFVDRQ